jgi:hypothetical protein
VPKPGLPSPHLSDAIGAIYDGAPERWPDAMGRLCEALGCVSGRLIVADVAAGTLHFGSAWNEPPGAADILASHVRVKAATLEGSTLGDLAYGPDTPFVPSHGPAVAGTLRWWPPPAGRHGSAGATR